MSNNVKQIKKLLKNKDNTLNIIISEGDTWGYYNLLGEAKNADDFNTIITNWKESMKTQYGDSWDSMFDIPILTIQAQIQTKEKGLLNFILFEQEVDELFEYIEKQEFKSDEIVRK